jgi:tetratricopeptide (TPR) repeat protein
MTTRCAGNCNRQQSDEQSLFAQEKGEHLELAPHRAELLTNNMNTPLRRPCQTALAALLLLWVGAVLPGLFAADDSSPAPAASPAPAWQTELDAVRVMEAAAALAEAKADPAQTEASRQKIIALYRQLADRYPDQPAALRACGDCLWRNEQSDDALAYWQRAQTLAPADAETADSLGSAYLRLGRVRDAAAQYQIAVTARPDHAIYQFQLANVLYLFRHELKEVTALPDSEAILRRSLEHFRRAAELAPASLPFAQAYAETYYLLARPDWEGALAAWQAVLVLSGDKPDFANSHLARISLRLGRAEEVKVYLDRIRDPAFDAMKTKFRQQADQIEAADSARQRNSISSPSR